ncbi:MAG: MCP four helix bundle domain-containing protein [Chloroflexi bacterium]|nr:MCP four helix bundle domain-containing protein [Chloroflexota bacterium]
MNATVASPPLTHRSVSSRQDEAQARRRWGIRAKLYAGFAPALFSLVVVGAFALYSLNHVSTLSSSMYANTLVPIEDLGEMRTQAGLLNMSVVESLADRSGASSYAAEAEITAATIERLEAGYAGTGLIAAERRGLATYLADWGRYQAAYRQVLHLVQLGRSSSAHHLYLAQVAPLSDKVTGDLASLIRVNDGEARGLAQQVDTASSTGRNLTITILAVALILSALIGFLLSRGITRAASDVARAAKGLAAGDIDQRVETDSSDELGQMAAEFRQMIAYQGRMAAAADTIARGEIDRDVELASERDVLGAAFQRMQTKLRQVAAAADAIARGEIDRDVELASERDVLGTAIQRMVTNLRDMVSDLQRGAQNLGSASSEILAATSQQASGATEQSAAIAQTTATVEEVKASAEQSSELATTLATSAQQANRAAGDGMASVGEAVRGMDDIRQKVQSIAENILALSEQSQQIGEIIATVNDLADQSNLLALNAAIEASRAGEHGKGFTVVAQEIRTLAEQSKKATAQVRTILSDIQTATNAAVMATEQGTKGVDAGSALIGAAGQTIAEMADVSQQTEQFAAQIAAATSQHAAGMEQIAAAMANINQATAQNLSATANTEQAAQNLTAVADNLNRLVTAYRF